MLSRSSDRRKGAALAENHETKWYHEALLYGCISVAAASLYLGSTEWMLRWLEWFRNQTTATLTATPSSPPPHSPSNQQLLAMAQQQAQAQALQNQISAHQVVAKHHPDPNERQKAILLLQQLGAPIPPPGALGELSMAVLQKP